MNTNFLFKVALGGLLLTVLYGITGIALGNSYGISHFFWSLLANFLVALVLGYFIRFSTYRGVRLSVIIFTIYFVIGHLNLQVEALIFNVADRPQVLRLLLGGLFVTVIFAPVYVFLFRNVAPLQPEKFTPRSVLRWIGKAITGDILYLLIYLTAGFTLSVLYPQLLEFYEGKLPPLGLMIKIQLFLRGFIFVGVAVLILRTTRLTTVRHGILIGLTFAIIGGIAPLIPPSELMPDYVRLGHGVEVGISNFLYGLILGYLLRQQPQQGPIKAKSQKVQESDANFSADPMGQKIG